MSDELLDLALADPPRAEATARELLMGSTDARARVLAERALGVVLRDRGELDGAVAHLARATRGAAALGDRLLHADVRATYGVALAQAGRQRSGLRHLDEAVALDGPHVPLTLLRRATVLVVARRRDEALA